MPTCTDESEDRNVATAGNAFIKLVHNNLCIKPNWNNLDSCNDGLDDSDGDSPLIIDVEEAVASIPADILDPLSHSAHQASQAPATSPKSVSPESVSESAVSRADLQQSVPRLLRAVW